VTAKVLNEPASLQDTGDGRNGRSSGTQHLTEKFLSQFEGVGLHSILNPSEANGTVFPPLHEGDGRRQSVQGFRVRARPEEDLMVWPW
jgi:hypothetical protein